MLYTDGVTEARRNGVLYGEERLLEGLTKLRRTPLALLPNALLDDVLAFTGGTLNDDTVVVCVRRSLE